MRAVMLGMPGQKKLNAPEYERARAVVTILFRYERACRRAGRPSSVMPDAGESSQVEGKASRRLERDVVLIADIERLLAALTPFDRGVIALVGVWRLSETAAAQRLHCNPVKLVRTYWRTVAMLYRQLVRAGYLRPIGESDAEDQTQKAGAQSSLAQMGAGTVCATRQRAGAGGL